MPYRSPLSELRFHLAHVAGFDRVAATGCFADATPETADAILSEAARLCDEVLAPLNRLGDRHPAVLENGVVRTSPGFAEGYRAIAEGGFSTLVRQGSEHHDFEVAADVAYSHDAPHAAAGLLLRLGEDAAGYAVGLREIEKGVRRW